MARLDVEKTQGQIASETGVTRMTVVRWEKDKYLPGDDALPALAGALHVNLVELRDRVVHERYRRRRERLKEAV